MIAENDKDLPANDLVYRLAAPSRLTDYSWIKPAQSTDEWIITENLKNRLERDNVTGYETIPVDWISP
jgi:alpha-glucosidase